MYYLLQGFWLKNKKILLELFFILKVIPQQITKIIIK